MKKALIFALALCLLLCGCGAREDAAIEGIRQQYAKLAAAEMEAEVTLHTPEEDRTFTLQCSYTPQKSTVRVLAPEELADITATVEGEQLTVSYGKHILPAGTLSGLCPANMLPYLLQAAAEGYLREYGREEKEGTDCCRLTLCTYDAGNRERICTLWLDADTLIPRYAEAAGEDGTAALSVKMLSFRCELTEE